MKIKILKLGESATESDVPAGSTVADAIKAAGFESPAILAHSTVTQCSTARGSTKVISSH